MSRCLKAQLCLAQGLAGRASWKSCTCWHRYAHCSPQASQQAQRWTLGCHPHLSSPVWEPVLVLVIALPWRPVDQRFSRWGSWRRSL